MTINRKVNVSDPIVQGIEHDPDGAGSRRNRHVEEHRPHDQRDDGDERVTDFRQTCNKERQSGKSFKFVRTIG